MPTAQKNPVHAARLPVAVSAADRRPDHPLPRDRRPVGRARASPGTISRTACGASSSGLGKKVLIADIVAGPCDAIFGLPAGQLSTPLAWVGIACYTLQIYFDFSGYSDMAIGLAADVRVPVPRELRLPVRVAVGAGVLAPVAHVALALVPRLPLRAARREPHGGLRTYLNLVTVFFLCGLWHGASWNFVVWGLFHGAFLVFERLGLRSPGERAPRPVRSPLRVGGRHGGVGVLPRRHAAARDRVSGGPGRTAGPGDSRVHCRGTTSTRSWWRRCWRGSSGRVRGAAAPRPARARVAARNGPGALSRRPWGSSWRWRRCLARRRCSWRPAVTARSSTSASDWRCARAPTTCGCRLTRPNRAIVLLFVAAVFAPLVVTLALLPWTPLDPRWGRPAPRGRRVPTRSNPWGSGRRASATGSPITTCSAGR